MCLRGSACIYQGEELGLPEADVAFEDLQDPYGREFWPEFKGRDGCRTPMVWSHNEPNGGFSKAARPWLPVPPDHLDHAMASNDARPDSLLNHYRAVIALRHDLPALAVGSLDQMTNSGSVLSFQRRHNKQTLYCAFNLSDTSADVTLPDGKWRPVALNLGACDPKEQKTIPLAPWQVCIMVKQ